MAQDFWQTHYQILCNLIKSNLSLGIHVKENLDTMIKNMKHEELNIRTSTDFSNMQTL